MQVYCVSLWWQVRLVNLHNVEFFYKRIAYYPEIYYFISLYSVLCMQQVGEWLSWLGMLPLIWSCVVQFPQLFWETIVGFDSHTPHCPAQSCLVCKEEEWVASLQAVCHLPRWSEFPSVNKKHIRPNSFAVQPIAPKILSMTYHFLIDHTKKLIDHMYRNIDWSYRNTDWSYKKTDWYQLRFWC